MYDKNELIKYLKTILGIPSPTGYTHEIINYIKDELEHSKVI
jgi:putative aminopeptidase FrvX